MTEIPEDIEGVEIVVEIHGASEDVAEELKEIFDAEEEDVVFSHAFGGEDIVSILTVLGTSTFGKLIGFWAKMKAASPKTTLKINKTSITMQGFSREDVEALLASPNFIRAVKAAKRK